MITKSLSSPSERNAQLRYENDPLLGDYIYSSSIHSWTNRRLSTDGSEFILMGRGVKPTDAQLALWNKVEHDLERLVAEATASTTQLLKGKETGLFIPQELILEEVRIESDMSVIFFFGFPRKEEVWMWPMVTFKDFAIAATEWTV